MEKDSALYQLMDVRMHSVINSIVNGAGEYQAILRNHRRLRNSKLLCQITNT